VTRKGRIRNVEAAPIVNYQEEFARIEAEVDRGNTDLQRLGFWALVRKVKVERRLAEHWADVVGRIDRKAFEGRVRPTLPVWLGNGVLLVEAGVVAAATAVAIRLAHGPSETGATVAGALALAAAVGLSVAVHCPAHWLVGRLVGIRFVRYFIGGPLKVTPGIKADYATYLRVDPGARAAMHASGAIASKIAPFAVFAPLYLAHREAGYELFPEWSLWGILGLGVLQILTDVLWSRKKSDWKKVGRERRLARAQEAAKR
jgi:hypothetical protein